MTTIAVIQPYFFPYAGYYRLFAAADIVVMFDCVQFPRRGWVHRNRFATESHEEDWLTLPLAKAAQNVRIDALQFAPDARVKIAAALERFPLLKNARRHPLIEMLLDVGEGDVATYLCAQIKAITESLGLQKPMVRSSSLSLSPELRGQERVIEVVRRLNGTSYVNPSGGRELYDHQSFGNAGLDLRFLTPYGGATASILTRLLSENSADVAAEIRAETILVP